MKPNTLLFTRDGTQIGNAIVVEVVGREYTVLTDYGNVVRWPSKAALAHLFTWSTSAQSWPHKLRRAHKHYTRRGRCKTCGFHGCRILVNLNRECVDCYTTARPL